MEKELQVPHYIEKLMRTNPTKYLEVVPTKEQALYLDYAIDYLSELLKDKEEWASYDREAKFLQRLQLFKVDLSFENRYGIKKRIKNEKDSSIKELMTEIEEDFMRCEFINDADLLASGLNDKSTSKYGGGIARFASIILSREKARIMVSGEDKINLKYIALIQKDLARKCKAFKETFAHDERELRKLLISQFDEDAYVERKDKDNESV